MLISMNSLKRRGNLLLDRRNGGAEMSVRIIERTALPDLLHSLIFTDKVRVSESNGVVQVEPVKNEADCTIGLRGMFAGDSNMTVDKFLERKHADKELDL